LSVIFLSVIFLSCIFSRPAAITFRQARGYLPSRRASPFTTLGQYQIILPGDSDRGTWEFKKKLARVVTQPCTLWPLDCKLVRCSMRHQWCRSVVKYGVRVSQVKPSNFQIAPYVNDVQTLDNLVGFVAPRKISFNFHLSSLMMWNLLSYPTAVLN